MDRAAAARDGVYYQLFELLEGSRRRLAQLMTQGQITHPSIRQAAAAELSTLPLLRRRVETEARLSQVSSDDLDRLLKWAEESVRRLVEAVRLDQPGTCPSHLADYPDVSLGLDYGWQVTFLAQSYSMAGVQAGFPLSMSISSVMQPSGRLWPYTSLRRSKAAGSMIHTLSPCTLTKEGGGPVPSERIRAFERIVDALAVRHGALLYAILAIGFL